MLRRALLVLWLLAYCGLTLFVCTVVLLMVAEASALSRGGGVGTVVGLGLLLVAWPASALVGVATAACGKTRIAWLVTGGTAGATLVLWLLAAVAALFDD